MPKDLHELPKLRDGLSYLYVERCRVDRQDASVAFWDKEGCAQAPAAALAVLMLGPGTTITHAAVRILADNGCSIVWVGEHGVRCYAQGGGETRKAHQLLRQAELVSDPEKHLEVVWRMYEKRFGYRLEHARNLEQVRGMEGVRVREAYAEAAHTYGIDWQGRNYDRQQWSKGDPANRALSAANACLNGVCHAAIVSGGYSPALGFVHIGRQLSFVYDIADLYKVEITIPLAFQAAAEGLDDLERRVRIRCRDMFREKHLLQRLLPDIESLLDVPTMAQAEQEQADADAEAGLPSGLWQTLWEKGVLAQDAGDGA
ncbi:MAG: type I-E CRISPR-associated endonuclease Cas1e [Anaerolineae bacterium]